MDTSWFCALQEYGQRWKIGKSGRRSCSLTPMVTLSSESSSSGAVLITGLVAGTGSCFNLEAGAIANEVSA